MLPASSCSWSPVTPLSVHSTYSASASELAWQRNNLCQYRISCANARKDRAEATSRSLPLVPDSTPDSSKADMSTGHRKCTGRLGNGTLHHCLQHHPRLLQEHLAPPHVRLESDTVYQTVEAEQADLRPCPSATRTSAPAAATAAGTAAPPIRTSALP
eukprot:2035836-Rhodomonas_salina.1